MNRTAKTLPALLGLLSIVIVPCLSRAQAPGDTEPKQAQPQSESQSTSPAKEAAPATATTTDTQPATPSHSRKATQHVKAKTTSDAKLAASVAKTPDLSKIEETALRNLDTAIQLARKMKMAPPPSWQNTGSNTDAFAKKQNDLQQAASGSSNQLSQAQILQQTTDALNELLTAIPANSVAASSPPEENHHGTSISGSAGVLGKLPLYLASTAIIVSLLALWRGWFLARREVERALTEAGLL